MPDDTPLSTSQASTETGIPKRTIQLALSRGELKAHKLPGVTGAWVINRADLNTWVHGRLEQSRTIAAYLDAQSEAAS